ncbi:hypothetical protein JOB18_019123 [Solea senegalensis]|uniref:L1 transposable element RRM domain-containing protein n=1 Tax=Solea senegalensis TaxID=28829 RepID=A0AAV6PD62_SOLSE|nr:hypothetical protein JOB18_019123 [Solea senegalensis]
MISMTLGYMTNYHQVDKSSLYSPDGVWKISKLSKSSACGDIKRHLRSHGANAMMQDQDEANEHEQQQANDIETKLSPLITRLDDVEKRVEHLEMTEKDWQANPPASKTDVRQIWDKLEDMENRLRRNNVRFVGFPEGREGGDAVKFLEELLPNLLDREGRREIEQAHRVASQRPTPGDRPRLILARFLRLSDWDAVLRAARNKGKLSWGNSTVMLFPDYPRATKMKRDKFRECKKKLHELGVSFRMLFPAKLRIETSEGEKAFDCPRKAKAFRDAMQ